MSQFSGEIIDGICVRREAKVPRKIQNFPRVISGDSLANMVPTGGNLFSDERDSFVRKKRLHYKLVPSAMLLSDQLSETDPSAAGMFAVGGDDVRTLPSLSHGSVSVCGRRREMEDAVTVAPEFLSGEFGKYDFFAVYDGHGGSRVAQVCRDRLHRIVAKEIEGYEELKMDLMINEVDWEKIMVTSFSKMDDEVNGIGVQEVEGGSDSMKTIGSTALVAIVGRDEFVIANCGDSRGILCRGGIAVPLSHDHKPERPDEMERVEAAGGWVINWNGYRVLGVLATSRSIGDLYLKPFVISKPEVTVNKRTNTDEFLIIGSDGLWDVVSNDVACEVVKKCFRMAKRFSKTTTRSVAGEAAAVLVELAMARGSKDNISVVVVELKDNNQKQCCGNGSSAN